MTSLSARFRQGAAEKKRYMLDYTLQLAEGEAVTFVEPTVTPSDDAPASPAFVISSVAIAPGGAQVAFYAAGGASGYSYSVQFLATTSIAQIFEDVVEFDIED